MIDSFNKEILWSLIGGSASENVCGQLEVVSDTPSQVLSLNQEMNNLAVVDATPVVEVFPRCDVTFIVMLLM